MFAMSRSRRSTHAPGARARTHTHALSLSLSLSLSHTHTHTHVLAVSARTTTTTTHTHTHTHTQCSQCAHACRYTYTRRCAHTYVHTHTHTHTFAGPLDLKLLGESRHLHLLLLRPQHLPLLRSARTQHNVQVSTRVQGPGGGDTLVREFSVVRCRFFRHIFGLLWSRTQFPCLHSGELSSPFIVVVQHPATWTQLLSLNKLAKMTLAESKVEQPVEDTQA